MSYDIGLYIHTGKEEVEVPGTAANYTYNVSPMLKLAFGDDRGINCLDKQPASVCALYLKGAVTSMEDYPHMFEPLNPPNGWGSYEGCLKWLRNILSHCEQHPLATLRIT